MNVCNTLVLLYHISVGSSLLVFLEWAMREPLYVERVTDTDSTLFYFQVLHIARESAAKQMVMNQEDFLSAKRLYHFTNRCSAQKILTSGKLKFGELKRMNDINESYRQIYAKDDVDPDDIYKELNKYRQISLTHDGRLLGFAIPSMWGHYAEKGYGICLVFDKEKLLQNLPKGCSKGNVHYKVNYSAEILVDVDNIQDYFQKNEAALFFSKTIDWEYEQEFRIITQSNDTLDYKDSLIAVIMYFADDIKNGDSVLGSEMAHSIERIVPDIPVLEFCYYFDEQKLQKNGEKWYPQTGDPIELI